jgi:peroxiredoxin
MKTKQRILLTGVAALALLANVWTADAADPDVGKPAPGFTLSDAEGTKRSLSDYKGKYVVLEWVNHGCPFVKKHYNSDNMQSLQKEFTAKDVVWLSISSSAKGKEGYQTPAEWKKTTQEKGAAPTAVLLDAEGRVGKLYGAKTTPHMFVIDPQGVLVYKGAIDDTPSADEKDAKTAKNYVRAALEESMAGKPVSVSATKSYGCSVKYK